MHFNCSNPLLVNALLLITASKTQSYSSATPRQRHFPGRIRLMEILTLFCCYVKAA